MERILVAGAGEATAERPEQLWLDVARPIQPRPPRERREAGRRPAASETGAGLQMELAMAARPRVEAVAARVVAVTAPPPPPCDMASAVARPCFVTWLLEQSKSGGTVGELAKAARADRMFPRAGGAEEVRARFDRAGADGDAYAALEDAERAYDRAA